MPFNYAHDALTWQRFEFFRLRQRQIVLRCMTDDCLTQRMLAGALERCSDAKDIGPEKS